MVLMDLMLYIMLYGLINERGVTMFNRILTIEKQIISLSKRVTKHTINHEIKISANEHDILESEGNLVEAVIDEYNAFIGENMERG